MPKDCQLKGDQKQIPERLGAMFEKPWARAENRRPKRLKPKLKMGKKRIITKEGAADAATPSEKKVKTTKRQVLNATANILVSYNNTAVAIADQKGEVIAW